MHTSFTREPVFKIGTCVFRRLEVMDFGFTAAFEGPRLPWRPPRAYVTRRCSILSRRCSLWVRSAVLSGTVRTRHVTATMSDAKRQKTGKTLALFDVDGTLTIPRKVRALRRRPQHPTRPRSGASPSARG